MQANSNDIGVQKRPDNYVRKVFMKLQVGGRRLTERHGRANKEIENNKSRRQRQVPMEIQIDSE